MQVRTYSAGPAQLPFDRQVGVSDLLKQATFDVGAGDLMHGAFSFMILYHVGGEGNVGVLDAGGRRHDRDVLCKMEMVEGTKSRRGRRRCRWRRCEKDEKQEPHSAVSS